MFLRVLVKLTIVRFDPASWQAKIFLLRSGRRCRPLRVLYSSGTFKGSGLLFKHP